jgi:hypothetical protein
MPPALSDTSMAIIEDDTNRRSHARQKRTLAKSKGCPLCEQSAMAESCRGASMTEDVMTEEQNRSKAKKEDDPNAVGGRATV